MASKKDEKKEKGQIKIEKLYELCLQFSKNNDLEGLLKELKEKYNFSSPPAKNILQRLAPYLVKTGKTLSFSNLASSGESKIHWSEKGMTISCKAVNQELYTQAKDKKINYSIVMHPDLSLTLKPISEK